MKTCPSRNSRVGNWPGMSFEPGNAYAMMATGFLGAGVFPTQNHGE
jgi:hypothetical protein